MPNPQDTKSYLDIDELSARTGLSPSTIWRLKRDGKISFFQPGGKGGRVKFPPDAIEVAGLNVEPDATAVADTQSAERLPGPSPKWMPPVQNNKTR